LTQNIVKALDVSGVAGFFTRGSMPLGRQNGGIGFPEIGVQDGTLAIDRW